MSLNYKKWDSLAAEVDADEAAEKSRQRELNKQRYFREQEEKQKKWREEKEKESKETHSHSEHCEHSKSQGDSQEGSDAHSLSPPVPPPVVPAHSGCGCGFMLPSQMEALKREYEANPSQFDTSSNEHRQHRQEVNHKKLAAIRSVREHGRELIQSKDFVLGIQVYERGLTIIAGAYDMDSSHQNEVNELEAIFNLNIGICKFHQKCFRECQSHCRACLQLQPNNVKAMYRYAGAAVEMGEYEEALEYLDKIIKCDGDKSSKDVIATKKEIERRKSEEKRKEREFEIKLSGKMHKNGIGGDDDGKEAYEGEESASDKRTEVDVNIP